MVRRSSPFALYLDTSAFVKLFVREEGSDRVRRLAGGSRGAGALLVSRLGHTEASVSFARMVHLGRLAAADLPRLLGRLDDYWEASIQEVSLTDSVLDDARQLAQRFPLGTCDAIHLASAREARRMLGGAFDGEVRFLAFDAALVSAAREIGFRVPAGR